MSSRNAYALVDNSPSRPLDPLISIVVPARNEARNLERVLPELPAVHEVILVDGNSTDDTIAAARRVLPDIKVVKQARTGKGNALAHGFAAATGHIIVMFDADGSADPAEIEAFVDSLLGGADFAKGSRFLAGGGSADITPIRRLGNGFLNTSANLSFGQRYSDLCYGYNAFWADILPYLDLGDAHAPAPSDGSMRWGDGFEIETLINCRIAASGLRIAEVPSVERARIFGESNLHAVRDGFRVLRTIARERHRATCEHSRGPELARMSAELRLPGERRLPVDARLPERGSVDVREGQRSADVERVGASA
jgi:glycosyltransferase involved in cell wall biosynthesis